MTDLRAELERILAEGAAAAKAAIDASVERARALLVTGAVTVDQEPRWTTLERAAALRGVTRETMAIHAERYGLGTREGRRWRIDENRVRALNEGRPYSPLTSRNPASNSTRLHEVPDAPTDS